MHTLPNLELCVIKIKGKKKILVQNVSVRKLLHALNESVVARDVVRIGPSNHDVLKILHDTQEKADQFKEQYSTHADT